MTVKNGKFLKLKWTFRQTLETHKHEKFGLAHFGHRCDGAGLEPRTFQQGPKFLGLEEEFEFGNGWFLSPLGALQERKAER